MLMRGKIAVAVIASGIPSLAHADLAISSKATQNLSCSSGVCTATAQNAVLNVGDLASLLASGDVAVKTGGGATNIVVKAFGWTNNSRLTLDANQSVEIDKPVSVTGSGGVTITTNDGGSAGDLMFDSKGNVKFWDTSAASSSMARALRWSMTSPPWPPTSLPARQAITRWRTATTQVSTALMRTRLSALLSAVSWRVWATRLATFRCRYHPERMWDCSRQLLPPELPTTFPLST